MNHRPEDGPTISGLLEFLAWILVPTAIFFLLLSLSISMVWAQPPPEGTSHPHVTVFEALPTASTVPGELFVIGNSLDGTCIGGGVFTATCQSKTTDGAVWIWDTAGALPTFPGDSLDGEILYNNLGVIDGSVLTTDGVDLTLVSGKIFVPNGVVPSIGSSANTDTGVQIHSTGVDIIIDNDAVFKLKNANIEFARDIRSTNGSGPHIDNSPMSITDPGYAHYSDPNTGLGLGGSDDGALIAGGLTAVYFSNVLTPATAAASFMDDGVSQQSWFAGTATQDSGVHPFVVDADGDGTADTYVELDGDLRVPPGAKTDPSIQIGDSNTGFWNGGAGLNQLYAVAGGTNMIHMDFDAALDTGNRGAALTVEVTGTAYRATVACIAGQSADCFVVQDQAVTPLEFLVIEGDGDVVVGTGQVLLAAGTEALPALAFAARPSFGLFDSLHVSGRLGFHADRLSIYGPTGAAMEIMRVNTSNDAQLLFSTRTVIDWALGTGLLGAGALADDFVFRGNTSSEDFLVLNVSGTTAPAPMNIFDDTTSQRVLVSGSATQDSGVNVFEVDADGDGILDEVGGLVFTAAGLLGIGEALPTDEIHMVGNQPAIKIEDSAGYARIGTDSHGGGMKLFFRLDQNGFNDVLWQTDSNSVEYADGWDMKIDEVRARDGDGLGLFSDGGDGVFIEDDGDVVVGAGNLDTGGGIRRQVDIYSANQTLTDANHIVIADTNAVTLTLPACVIGQELRIKSTAGGGSTVTVDGAGSDTIDGTLTITLNHLDGVDLICTATNTWSVF